MDPRLQQVFEWLTSSYLPEPDSGRVPSALLPNKAAVPGSALPPSNTPSFLQPTEDALRKQGAGLMGAVYSPLGAAMAIPGLAEVAAPAFALQGAASGYHDVGKLAQHVAQGEYAQAGGDLVNTAGDVAMMAPVIGREAPGLTILDKGSGTEILHGKARLAKAGAAVIKAYDLSPADLSTFTDKMVEHGGPKIFEITKNDDPSTAKAIDPAAAFEAAKEFLTDPRMTKATDLQHWLDRAQLGEYAKNYYRDKHDALLQELGGDERALGRARDTSKYETATGAGYNTGDVIRNTVRSMQKALNPEAASPTDKMFTGRYGHQGYDTLSQGEARGRKQGPYDDWKAYWMDQAAKEMGIEGAGEMKRPHETVIDQQMANLGGVPQDFGMETGRDYLDFMNRIASDKTGMGLDQQQAAGWRGEKDIRATDDNAPTDWAGTTLQAIMHRGGADRVYGNDSNATRMQTVLGAYRAKLNSKGGQQVEIPGLKEAAPPTAWMDEAVRRLDSPEHGNGFTFDPISGDPATHGYAYVPRGKQDRAMVTEGSPTLKQFAKWVSKNQDIFASDPSAHAGGWTDGTKKWIDVSHVAPDIEEALAKVAPGEKALWSIHEGKEIPLEWHDGVPSVKGDTGFEFGDNIVPQLSGVRSTVTLKDGRVLKSDIVPHGGPLQTHLSLIEQHGVDPSSVVDTGFEIDGEPSQGGGGTVGRGMITAGDYEQGRKEPYVPYAKRKKDGGN